MKKLLSTTALIALLATSGLAFADNDNSSAKDSSGGKEWHSEHSYMSKALSKLPEADAAKFRDTMKQARESDKSLHEQEHKLHKELHDLMTADKFDKAAFIAKSKEIRQASDTSREHMTEAFATALSQLSPEERKTLAESMHKGMHKHHKGEHGDTKKSGDASAGDKPQTTDKAPDAN